MLVREDRIVVSFAGKAGTDEGSSGMLAVTYLDSGGSFTGVCTYKNLLSYNHICVLYTSHSNLKVCVWGGECMKMDVVCLAWVQSQIQMELQAPVASPSGLPRWLKW